MLFGDVQEFAFPGLSRAGCRNFPGKEACVGGLLLKTAGRGASGRADVCIDADEWAGGSLLQRFGWHSTCCCGLGCSLRQELSEGAGVYVYFFLTVYGNKSFCL